MIPLVFSSFREPKAMEGRRQAKYRKIMVVMYLPMALLLPIMPKTKPREQHEQKKTTPQEMSVDKGQAAKQRCRALGKKKHNEILLNILSRFLVISHNPAWSRISSSQGEARGGRGGEP